MKILIIATYISLFLFSDLSYGVDLARPATDEDFAVLPPYCKTRTLSGETRYVDPSLKKLWMDRFGSDFQHVHHYCWGLFYVYKAHKTFNKGERNAFLGYAIGEMQYTQKHTSPQLVLQPKISYDIGKIREELDDNAGAIQDYYKCIKLNPKIATPYAAISDLFKKQNNTKEALAILEQGLKYKPKSKALLKRLEKLSKEK